LAAAARVQPGATIEAFHVIVDLAHAAISSEELAIEQMRELREGTAFERADATRLAFVSWMAGLPEGAPKIEWKEVIGAEEEMVAREADDADLLVLAKPRNAEGHHALHAAVFRCGRPLLLAPSGWPPAGEVGRKVVIAWNGTGGAWRAVAGALPWIVRAEEVTILLVAEPEDVAAELVAWLESEGVEPRVRSVPRASGHLGDQLIDEADAIGADMLVMGAYRYNEPLEWLLGGTTRHALRHADLPLILAH
jgi:nucleotide-binding universal stress UspA family protein